MQHLDDYEVLKARVLSPGQNGVPPKCIAVTGCARRDGTSTVASGLARALARDASRRVLLVDANLRHPILAKAAGIGKGTGITEFVHEKRPLKDVLHPTSIANLSLLTAGTPNGHHPADVFSDKAFQKRLAQLKAQFDLIIWDTPALTPFADVSVLAPLVDGVILVVRAERTRWQAAQSAKAQLETARANILGVVLNRRRHVIPKLLYQCL